MSAETIGSAAADADAAPLDLLLTDAALGVLNRVNPGGSGLRLAAALAARPRLVAGRTRNLLGEMARIAAGTSQMQPSRRDRRFADPALTVLVRPDRVVAAVGTRSRRPRLPWYIPAAAEPERPAQTPPAAQPESASPVTTTP